MRRMNSARKLPRTGIRRGAILFLLALAVFLSVSSGTDLPKKPWLEKDWTQWTDEDCNIVLGGSPWAYSASSSFLLGEEETYGTFALLRSALPIRQAILRQLQLEDHYDKMKPDKKQAFDQAHAHDLDPIDEVKVYIKNWRDDGVDPAVPRQAVLRLPNGTLVEPIETNEVKYDSGGMWEALNQFEYVFPRTVGGDQLYSSNNSFVEVVLGAPLTIDKKTKKVVPEPFQDVDKHVVGIEIKDKKTGDILRTGQIAIPFGILDFSNLMYKGKLEY